MSPWACAIWWRSASSPWRSSSPFVCWVGRAAPALSRECVGALIAIEREMALGTFVHTGEPVDGEVSPPLLRAIFSKRSPLHDGAVILCSGRIAAAACQLPLSQPPEGPGVHMG